MNRDDLTSSQLEVVEATEPLVLVLGGAGSGKTTTALWAGREHLDRPDTPPTQRVLFVTFSRTAVGQIARRAGAVFAGVGERIEIHTFHALAYRLVRAFGRYAGHGTIPPRIESEARKKLLGRDRALLSYDELLPTAASILASKRISALIAARWGLVICDEFQDTNDFQWGLLQTVSGSARLLLLADPNQMIYTFIPTVGAVRLDDARARADRVVDLEEVPHRDPSGVIPAMARAVRRRSFDDPAVAHAVDTGMLRVCTATQADLCDRLLAELRRLRTCGCGSVGIFETTNAGAAMLGADLTERGVAHTLIGLPEAHGEAILAMATMTAFGLRARSFEDVRRQLAVFLTAATRTPRAPPVAVQLLNNTVQNRPLQQRLGDLEAALGEAEDFDTLVGVSATAWDNLGIGAGGPVWRRAAASFAALARQTAATNTKQEALADDLEAATEQLRTEALITEEPIRARVQVMNFHQTKGREADGVILIYREAGFVTRWDAREPFAEASRVLYVALTRARSHVTVVLPPVPHALIAPFART